MSTRSLSDTSPCARNACDICRRCVPVQTCLVADYSTKPGRTGLASVDCADDVRDRCLGADTVSARRIGCPLEFEELCTGTEVGVVGVQSFSEST